MTIMELVVMPFSEDTVISCKHATTLTDSSNSKVASSWLDNLINISPCHQHVFLSLILQRFVGLVLMVTHTTLLYGMYVPDWEYEFTSQDNTLKHFMVIKLINKKIILCIFFYEILKMLLILAMSFCYIKVKCGVRGDTEPGCNAVGMIDRRVLGIQHLYKHPTYLRTVVCRKYS